MPHPYTKRRKIGPRRVGSVWVAAMIDTGYPPVDYADWQEYQRWYEGKQAIAGLPAPGSAEGKRLLARLKISLR